MRDSSITVKIAPMRQVSLGRMPEPIYAQLTELARLNGFTKLAHYAAALLVSALEEYKEGPLVTSIEATKGPFK